MLSRAGFRLDWKLNHLCIRSAYRSLRIHCVRCYRTPLIDGWNLHQQGLSIRNLKWHVLLPNNNKRYSYKGICGIVRYCFGRTNSIEFWSSLRKVAVLRIEDRRLSRTRCLLWVLLHCWRNPTCRVLLWNRYLRMSRYGTRLWQKGVLCKVFHRHLMSDLLLSVQLCWWEKPEFSVLHQMRMPVRWRWVDSHWRCSSIR